MERGQLWLTELARQMDKLNEKRAQLQQVTDKLQALNDEFAAMTKKKKDLEDNIGIITINYKISSMPCKVHDLLDLA